MISLQKPDWLGCIAVDFLCTSCYGNQGVLVHQTHIDVLMNQNL